MPQLKSKERRIRREKTWIGNEFEKIVQLFLEDVSPVLDNVFKSKNKLRSLDSNADNIETILLAHDEKCVRYVENIRKNPKYHVSPKDEDMFLQRANYLVAAYFLSSLKMPPHHIKIYFPNMMAENDFYSEIERVICEKFQPKEKIKINYTEIQKKTFFSGILNLVSWFVSLLKRK